MQYIRVAHGYPHLQASLMQVFSLAGKKMREAALFSCVHLRIGVPTIYGDEVSTWL